ncbi:hypothetical protein ACIQZO_06120 [Streptomyces sp. NPDC097617]|uniref:hypothetical protein n=1 Tax=Streptomyces sp. NPDC097617 TaxID=3366091 RepID=UPI0037F8B425
MSDFVRIRPTADRRVAFARWAVAQDPKIRTSGPDTFTVPVRLLPEMPEGILIGSFVDGHRYISPEEDQAEGKPAPGAELLGVATAAGLAPEPLPEHEATPGEPLPELPDEAYAPEASPLPGPETPDEATGQPDGAFPCSGCGKEFSTERGRDTHHRRKHVDG